MSEEALSSDQTLYSVFISYAHADDNDADVSKRWVQRLRVQLSILVRQNQVCIRSDKDLHIGEKWHEIIQSDLKGAKAAVLLVGPKFLDSDYVRNYELPVLLDKAKNDGLVIMPIIVGPCLIEETIFQYPDSNSGPDKISLSAFQLANPPDKPLNGLKEFEQEQVFVSVSRRLLQLIQPSESNGEQSNQNEQVGAVRSALSLLSDFIRETPEVRDAGKRFQNDFLEASAQIDLMSAYKDLHDLLHTLQFQCCDLIGAELSLFPEDVASGTRLIDPELTLQETIDTIREQEERWKNASIETEWLLADLEISLQELQRAVADAGNARLRRAFATLARVLNRYPVQINARLLEVARGLRLPGLIQAMTDIQSHLTGAKVKQSEVQRFILGVTALTKLHTRLKELLYEHDQWQTTDSEMRLIQVSADDFLEDLRALWPRLKVITKVLYHDNARSWAQRFKADSERLESALEGPNPSSARDSYRRYRRAAGIRFFEVDVELKKLCSELQRVGEPLDQVLRILDADED